MSVTESVSEGGGESAPRTYMAYASGNGGIAILRQIAVFFPMYFYSPPAGKGDIYLQAAYVGYALMLARLIDVLSDPIVGYLSDRTRHRWGKRLPYMVYGTPLWLFFTVLIFTPPASGHSMVNFWYLTATASLYFIAMTVVQIPYMAVLPEITRSEDEAVRVSARMGKFYLAGVLLILAGGFLAADKIGFLGATIGFCAIAAIPFLLALRELFGLEQRPVEKDREPFLRSAWAVIRQRPFLTYLIGHSLFILGYYVMLVACSFLVTEIVRLPLAASGAFLLLAMVCALAAAPIVERLSLRFGKKPVMLGAMLVYGFILSCWFLIGKCPSIEGSATLAEVMGIKAAFAQNVRFGVLVEVIIFFVLAGAASSVQMLLPNAIVADLVVFDERQTGRRREALVFGLQGGIEKNAVMLATLIASLSLSLGKDAQNPMGIYVIGPIAAFACFIGFLVFLLYPLNRGWQDERTAEETA